MLLDEVTVDPFLKFALGCLGHELFANLGFRLGERLGARLLMRLHLDDVEAVLSTHDVGDVAGLELRDCRLDRVVKFTRRELTQFASLALGVVVGELAREVSEVGLSSVITPSWIRLTRSQAWNTWA